ADRAVAADLAVMHEEVAAMNEGVAVRPRRRRAGRGPDMGEEQMRAYLPRDREQVFVGPGGPDLAVLAGFGPLAIPADAEAVAIGAGLGLLGMQRLVDQRMA